MRVLFVPFGSEGDVNPLVWMARGLQAVGHEPVFLITPHYQSRVAGMEWHAIGREEDFFRMASDPDLWKPVRGTFRVAQAMTESLAEYRRVFQNCGGGFDLVVTSSFGFGAACLAEARNIPRLMLHLQPVCMRSTGDFPLMAKGTRVLRHAPSFAKRLTFGMADLLLNSTLLPPLNEFRKSLGLPAWRDFYRDALMGGDGIGVLYPEWFGPPQPEWPDRARQFGFPISRHEPAALPAELQAWMGAGPQPVVWTHGSANLHVKDFHKLAVKVSQKLKIRSLLVSRQPPEIPLPQGVFHFSHVPFEDLFPHCAAVVHHAGIGTVSKAFAAGIPQMCLPLAHDQFDNAFRISELKAGAESAPNVGGATRTLQHLLTDSGIASGVAACRKKSTGGDLQGLLDFAQSLTVRR